MSEDLEKIYKKFFDDSGNMKQSGKDIVSKGMKGISQGPKTITEKGAFLPKTQSAIKYATKAAKASRYGKIAAGVAAAGLAAKEYLKSKMDKKDVDKKSMGGSMKKGYGQARQSGMGLQDENVSLGKGSDYIKDLL